jgi:hypothetical protein
MLIHRAGYPGCNGLDGRASGRKPGLTGGRSRGY